MPEYNEFLPSIRFETLCETCVTPMLNETDSLIEIEEKLQKVRDCIEYCEKWDDSRGISISRNTEKFYKLEQAFLDLKHGYPIRSYGFDSNERDCQVCEECDISILIEGESVEELEDQLRNLIICQEACERCDKQWSDSKKEAISYNIPRLEQPIAEKYMADNMSRLPRNMITGHDLTQEDYNYAMSKGRTKNNYQRDEDQPSPEGYAFNVRRAPRK